MDIHESKGWRNRRRLAEIKQADWQDDDRAAVRAERQRMRDEEAAANRASVEASEAALAAATCRCTACGGSGKLSVEAAMRVVRALHDFGFQGYRPTKSEIAALAALSKGIEVPASMPQIAFSYGSVSPAPTVAVAPSLAPIEVVTLPKARPAKGRENNFLEDGALIEV